MFIREHRIRGYHYIEVLETYRDPVTRKPKHRVVVRWPLDSDHGSTVESASRYVRNTRRKARRLLRNIERAPIDDGLHRRRRRILQAEERRATALLAGLTEAKAGLARSDRYRATGPRPDGGTAPRYRMPMTTDTPPPEVRALRCC
jgi:hypothetical protein